MGRQTLVNRIFLLISTRLESGPGTKIEVPFCLTGGALGRCQLPGVGVPKRPVMSNTVSELLPLLNPFANASIAVGTSRTAVTATVFAGSGFTHFPGK